MRYGQTRTQTRGLSGWRRKRGKDVGGGGGGGGSRSHGATVWRGGRGEMTGGRLHHDIRHSSFPPPSLLSFFDRNLRISSSSASLSSTRRHAAFRNVTPVTDCWCRGRDNNNCQRSNVSRVGYGQETKQRERVKKSEDGIARREQLSRREKGHREERKGSRKEGKDSAGRMVQARVREKERTVRSIYRTGNKHEAAGVDPSGYRFVYTASACRGPRAKWSREKRGPNSPTDELRRLRPNARSVPTTYTVPQQTHCIASTAGNSSRAERKQI